MIPHGTSTRDQPVRHTDVRQEFATAFEKGSNVWVDGVGLTWICGVCDTKETNELGRVCVEGADDAAVQNLVLEKVRSWA